MNKLWLRIIYTAHMLAPLPLVSLHIARLDVDTAERLRTLFP
jgi:hypothetical protein